MATFRDQTLGVSRIIGTSHAESSEIDPAVGKAPELITNGDFSSWAGAGHADVPTGWTYAGTQSSANKVAESSGALRWLSDGAGASKTYINPCSRSANTIASS